MQILSAFSEFNQRRERSSATCDGTSRHNDQIVVSFSLRAAALKDSQYEHLGNTKMMPSTRLFS